MIEEEKRVQTTWLQVWDFGITEFENYHFRDPRDR